MKRFDRSLLRVAGLIFITGIASACTPIKLKNQSFTRGVEREKVKDHPLANTFDDVKGQNIAAMDPLLPPGAAGAAQIDINEGKGYYATFVSPRELETQYQELETDLTNIAEEELKDPQVREMRDSILAKVKSSLVELQGQTQPIFRFYTPFFSITKKYGPKTITRVSIGAFILHVNLGMTTVNIDPNLIPMNDINAADGFLDKTMIWCRNQACRVANNFKAKSKIVGLRGGLAAGSDLVVRGAVAVNWHRGGSGSMIPPGKVTGEMEFSTMAGLASYSAYVDIIDGKPRLRLPAGVVLNVDTVDLLTRAFHGVLAAGIGADANPIALDTGYYVGVKKNGTMGAVLDGKAFDNRGSGKFLRADIGLQAIRKDSDGDIEMTALVHNKDCVH